MSETTFHRSRAVVRAILLGGALAAIFDAIDAVVAYKLVLGIDPIAIYQFVASGMLGPSAFGGGIATALVGVAVHLSVAFGASAVFVAASTRMPQLARAYTVSGPLFGVAVWAVMNLVVIPLSRTPASPFSLPLFLNGVLGHVVFVGLPIAYAAHRYLSSEERSPAVCTHPIGGESANG
ncbi:MAG TPA: hypothetical protein VNO21_23840 [Polyangiaceae bacterium]|nr:hypothetical protein [Polyangiaceae bacterium]